MIRVAMIAAGRVGGRELSYGVPAFAALLAVQTWFGSGAFVATGDVAPFLRTNLMSELSSMWGHSLVGAGSASFQPTARAPELLMLELARIVGADGAFAQRLLYSVLGAGVALAGVWFARTFVDRAVPSAAAGIIVFFNPYVLQQLPNPLPLWTIGIMALTGGLILRAARGEHVAGWVLAVASVPACYLAVNPPLLAMVAAWVALMALLATPLIGPAGCGRALGLLARGAPWALLLNLWWLVPLVATLANQGVGYEVQAQTDVLAWSWTHRRLSLPNVLSLDGHWGWAHAEYFPFAEAIDRSVWSPLRFGLPLVALTAPIVAAPGRRRAAAVMVGWVVALTFLAKGLHSPFTDVNLLLYRHVPGMWLLREPMSKLGPMLVLLLASLVAIALSGAAELRIKATGRRLVALPALSGVILVGALGFNHPMWTGAVIPRERPLLPSAHVEVPDGWKRLAAALNAAPDSGKALVLPLADFYQMSTTWGYYGVDHVPRVLLERPTIQFLPGSYYGDLPTFGAAVRQVQTSLLNGDRAAVSPLLRSLGVSYVILRRDLKTDLPGRSHAPVDALARGLRSAPGIASLPSFGVAEVYRLDQSQDTGGPLLRTVARAFDASTVPDRLLPFAVASLPRDAATVDGTTKTDGSVAVLGPTGRSVDLGARNRPVQVVPRRIGPELVELSEHIAEDGSVWLTSRRITEIGVQGRPLYDRDLGAHQLSGVSSIAAVRTSAGLTPLHEGRGVVALRGPSETIVAYEAQPSPLRLVGAMTRVRDCNARDDRTLDQVGIAAAPLGGDDGGVVLEAVDHSACVRLGLGEGPIAHPVLLEMEYRTVKGSPARVCLWEEGPDRCLGIAPMRSAPGWQRYTAVFDPSADATGTQLFLYADGPATGGRTEVEYRAVRASQLRPAATVTVDVPALPRTIVDVLPGARLESTTDLPVTLERVPLEVRDCNAFDDRTIREAGLRMKRLPEQPGFRLHARTHAACVSAAVHGFVPGGAFALRLEARTISGLPARVCLWQEGLDRCAALEPIERSERWSSYEALVTPDVGATGLRLFLYADGATSDQTETIVAYRRIRVVPASSVAVAVVDVGRARRPPSMSWDRIGVSSFRIDVDPSDSPFLLTMGESAADGWSMKELPEGRTATPVTVDGYARGWLISSGPALVLEIAYQPDRWFRWSIGVSLLAGLTIPALGALRRRGIHRRPGRPGVAL
jgi:arabinofuranan 3-O-arabinosyltransferase